MRGHLAQVSFPISPAPSQEPCHAQIRANGGVGRAKVPVRCPNSTLCCARIAQGFICPAFRYAERGLVTGRARAPSRCVRLASHLLLLSRTAADTRANE